MQNFTKSVTICPCDTTTTTTSTKTATTTTHLLARVLVGVEAEEHPQVHHAVALRAGGFGDGLEEARRKVPPQAKPLPQRLEREGVARRLGVRRS